MGNGVSQPPPMGNLTYNFKTGGFVPSPNAAPGGFVPPPNAAPGRPISASQICNPGTTASGTTSGTSKMRPCPSSGNKPSVAMLRQLSQEDVSSLKRQVSYEAFTFGHSQPLTRGIAGFSRTSLNRTDCLKCGFSNPEGRMQCSMCGAKLGRSITPLPRPMSTSNSHHALVAKVYGESQNPKYYRKKDYIPPKLWGYASNTNGRHPSQGPEPATAGRYHTFDDFLQRGLKWHFGDVETCVYKRKREVIINFIAAADLGEGILIISPGVRPCTPVTPKKRFRMQQLSVVADHSLLDMAFAVLPPAHLYFSLTDFLSRQLRWTERDIVSSDLNTKREVMIASLAERSVKIQRKQKHISNEDAAILQEKQIASLRELSNEELLMMASKLFALDFDKALKGQSAKVNLSPFLLTRLKTRMHTARKSLTTLTVAKGPRVQRLIIDIQAANKLADADNTGASDPFCVLYWGFDTRSDEDSLSAGEPSTILGVSKQIKWQMIGYTSVKLHTKNPKWLGEQFAVQLPCTGLMKCCFLVEVRDFDPPAATVQGKKKKSKKDKKKKKGKKKERVPEMLIASSNFEHTKNTSDFLGQAEIPGCTLVDMEVDSGKAVINAPLRPKGGMTAKEACFVHGNLQLGLKLQEVHLNPRFSSPVEALVDIVSGKGLPVSRSGDIPDSFVEARVDGAIVGESGICINQRNPEFGETWVIQLNSAEAEAEIQIIDYESESGLKLSLGRVLLPSALDLGLSTEVLEGVARGRRDAENQYTYDSGLIEWPLKPPKYIGRTWVNNPLVEPICVTVKCATDLAKADSGSGKKSKSDPYAMLWWTSCKGMDPRSKDDVRIGETNIVADNNAPLWMETFPVPVPSPACIQAEGLVPEDCALLCQIFDSDAQGADDFLGQAKLTLPMLMSAKGEMVYELKSRSKRKSFAAALKGQPDDKKLIHGRVTINVDRSRQSATAATTRIETLLQKRTMGCIKMRVRMGESSKFLMATGGSAANEGEASDEEMAAGLS